MQASAVADNEPTTLAEALLRLKAAEDTLRAVGNGEVDAFIVPDGRAGQKMFTLATVDRQYRMFVENMRDGAATLSDGGLILYANHSLADLLGCPVESLVGSTLAEFLPGHGPLGDTLTGGDDGFGTAFECELQRAGGDVVPVRVTTSPLDEGGSRLICMTFTDLSAQRAQDQEIARLVRAKEERLAELQRAEAALRSSESTLRSILDALPFGVIVSRPSDGMTYVNHHAAAIVGEHADQEEYTELMRRYAFREGTDDHYPEDEFPVVRALRGERGTLSDLEFDLEGTRVPVRMSYAGIGTDGEQVELCLVTFTDLVQERAAERQLMAQADELERSNAELEQFAYIASHDLSEPLRTVASFVQLLSQRYEGKLDADADEFIGFALEGVKRMQVLIQDLLTYSRVSRTELNLAPVDTGRIVRELAVSLDGEGSITVGTDLPTVLADEGELRRVFQNLLANAMKFAAPGRPLSVEVGVSERRGEWCFSVADNGIGIAPDHRELVFKMFRRLHSQDDYAGTGIGLSVCERIVERLGGRIWVEGGADDTPEGQGTTFLFTLPRDEHRP